MVEVGAGAVGDVDAGPAARYRRRGRAVSVGVASDGVVADVGEVDLVELGVTGHLAQRPHLDARLVHVDDEVGEPLVLGRVGIGACDEHPPP